MAQQTLLTPSLRGRTGKGNLLTVYVIDGHALVRDALGMLIQRIKPGEKVVLLNRLNALELAVFNGGPPELICMELQLPGTMGLNGLRMVRANYPNTPLAVITANAARDYEENSILAGANVFIPKSDHVNQILIKLRNLLVTGDPVDELSIFSPPKLSKRQRQLILMLDLGLSNRVIADKLGITEYTVKVHFWRLFRRLGVNSRMEALHYARTHGWLGI
jgi:DNA-binding NarL/FixJ family response regulator